MTHAQSKPAHLAEHFTDAEQQHESAKLGMWVFLLTEVLLFGGLFVAYVIYRAWYPEMFIDAHKQLSVLMGGINTVVLITSSVTMALAIRSVQLNNMKASKGYLIATILLAGCFLLIKYFEYSHKFHLGQLPGKFYSFDGVKGSNPHLFFSIYFLMTGLHGLHVIIGMCAIGWAYMKVASGKLTPTYYTPVEMVGLYWHLVDLIWIYLFPLLYLIG